MAFSKREEAFPQSKLAAFAGEEATIATAAKRVSRWSIGGMLRDARDGMQCASHPQSSQWSMGVAARKRGQVMAITPRHVGRPGRGELMAIRRGRDRPFGAAMDAARTRSELPDLPISAGCACALVAHSKSSHSTQPALRPDARDHHR